MLADENGSVTDTYDYDAFGNLINSTGDTVNNYRYCGEQFDGTTGLYYLRARYMNPSTGTFISMDSYSGSINDPMSLHKYLYANANPVTYQDPSGYYSIGEMAVSMAVSGIIGGITSAGLNLLTQLTTKEPNEKINWTEVILDGVTGFLFGAAFGMFGYVGMWYQSAAIMYALSATCVVGFVSSATMGCVYFSQGNYTLGGVYFFLAFLSANGAFRTQAQAVSFQQQSQTAAGSDGWGNWEDYNHTTSNGRTYANVNGRNYSHHAVDRMQPSGYRYNSGQAILQVGGDYGRSVSPHVVEYVISTSVPNVQPNGNILYTNGSVTVVTNSNGDVVTIMTK
jgi:RHS repeat-associated protein